MNCFYHSEHSAVGICKSCNRGICQACLTEVENGIACTATCVDEVKMLNSMIKRNAGIIKSHFIGPIFIIALGAAFAYVGIQTEGMGLALYFGVLFILWGVVSLFYAAKKNRNK
jgi:hypothetical protein